ncbi:MAG: proline--tRNA ligase [Deltaproteobacteria bacterium]|nr:proline--tRNA ligase [Candidatus Anaeroferrophillus wilburensis]MBN2889349.1 proline--tRNA ligase [Deltaproteobacteria bacterium]
MRFSQMYIPTLKETPAEAEVVSHQLMLRAGMIRRLAAGIYTYLPLGLMAVRNVEKIVREEMNRAGAQELLLPGVQPAELWQESGRWEQYGKELLRFTDRHQRGFCLGPTHEEVITDLVRHEIRSYRQLPLNLYQIQTKFRDEIRPRFGLMRGREFIMKDAYSFDVDDQSAEQSYRIMRDAYERIFARCGLDFRAVEADSGAIGGSFSHEFVVLAASGEDGVATCRSCSYAANVEKAERICHDAQEAVPVAALPEEVATPGCTTIEEVSAFFQIRPRETVKTMVYDTDQGSYLVVVNGARQVSETKLKTALGVQWVQLAEVARVRELCAVPVGSLGPVAAKLPVVVDQEVPRMPALVCGANRENFHLRNVVYGRDFTAALVGDLTEVQAGDHCPHCHAPMDIVRGIEVGHIFKLGTKYSEALSASYLDQHGKEQLLVMGCYGIGIGRTVAAAIEQNHDQQGIIFPYALAPFKVALLCLDGKNDEVLAYCDRLHDQLVAKGIDVLYDDRDERPGIKFKDADLMGVPVRITVGKKGFQRGVVEVKERRAGDVMEVPIDDLTVLWELIERLAADDQGLSSL